MSVRTEVPVRSAVGALDTVSSGQPLPSAPAAFRSRDGWTFTRTATWFALVQVLASGGCGDGPPLEPVEQANGLASTVTAAGFDCGTANQIPQIECEALVALFHSTNGPTWTNSTNWLASDLPCTWHGVSCASGAVTFLLLGSNGLAGSIPAELGDLSKLVILSLPFNQLTGAIPPELGRLSDLLFLNLFGNRLTGAIPPELGELSRLTTLQLTSNQLTGSIPPELGSLAELRHFDAIANQLTGAIPPELGNLAELQAIQLGANQLTGMIPMELGNLSNLQVLELQSNALSGPIPRGLGGLSDMLRIVLWGNQLSGLIPVEIAALGGSIQELDVATSGCSFRPPGNTGLFMPDVTAYRAHDHDGDGFICGIAFTADSPRLADDLKSVIVELDDEEVLNGGQANALTRKIDQALRLEERGRIAEAVAVLEDFIQQVRDLTEAVLDPAQAAELIARAEMLIELMLP